MALDWLKNLYNNTLGEIFPKIGQSGTTGASLFAGADNFFTGNLDFQRELEMLSKNQEFNALEASKSRDWQTQMSNTAYQRAVADMKSAGLNPYLAYSQGGASVGSGATASASGSHSASGKGFSALLSLVGSIAGDAMSAATKQSTEALRAQTAKDIANDRLEQHQYYLDARAAAYEDYLQSKLHRRK